MKHDLKKGRLFEDSLLKKIRSKFFHIEKDPKSKK